MRYWLPLNAAFDVLQGNHVHVVCHYLCMSKVKLNLYLINRGEVRRRRGVRAGDEQNKVPLQLRF